MEDAGKAKAALPGAVCARCLVLHGGCLRLCSWGGCWPAASKKHPMWERQGGEERQDPLPQHQFLPGRESLCPTQLRQDSAFGLQGEQRHLKTSLTAVSPCCIHPPPLGSTSPS